MQLAHLAHELLLRLAHVEQRLAGLGIAEEDDEVDRVALAQRHADLRVVLEAADAGAVAGTRIDDDVRTPLGVDGHALGRNDAHQRIVDRALELAAVDDGLVVEVQDRRQARLRVLDEVVAALADRVPEQDRALRGVDGVLYQSVEDPGARRRAGRGVADAVVLGSLRQTLRELLARELRALAEQQGHLGRDVVASRQFAFGIHAGPFGVLTGAARRETSPECRPRAACQAACLMLATISAITSAVAASPIAPTALPRTW